MPKDFVHCSFQITTDAYEMGKDELYETAKVVSGLRKNFRKKAKELVRIEGMDLGTTNEQILKAIKRID